MYRGNLGGKFSETNREGTLFKQKMMKISIDNLKSAMADRTCALCKAPESKCGEHKREAGKME